MAEFCEHTVMTLRGPCDLLSNYKRFKEHMSTPPWSYECSWYMVVRLSLE